MAKIRVAIVGVGNCASSLIQGIEFYRGATGEAPIPGLMHLDLGGYHVGDIECVAAFDVAAEKWGTTSPRRSWRRPTTRRASLRCRRPGSRSGAARPMTGSGNICAMS